jgi:cytoskeletal protein CcmA (bactofilin family)
MFLKGSRSVGQVEARRVAKSTAGALFLAVLALLWAPSARADTDTTAVGREIVIPEGSTANDIACVFCRVRVHGDVRGDVAIAFGKLEVDPGHEIAGDVAVFAGKVMLAENSRVSGDVAIIGRLESSGGAAVGGSHVVVPEAILLVPLLLLAGLIWLIVHLVQRSRYRAMYPPYPPGYPGRRL